MNLVNYYRLLGLNSGAELEEIKSSYRRLARQYHPDANPGNQEAHAQFIRLTEAYKFLMGVVKKSQVYGGQVQKLEQKESLRSKVRKVNCPQPPLPMGNELSDYEEQLKWQSYENLQQLLKNHRFARAIALVEGLAQRLPQDPEVRQWQAIAYQQWGRKLIAEGELDKGRIYLQKALRTDPYNRSLSVEVEQEFHRLEVI